MYMSQRCRAMILLHTEWNAELNVRVSFFNELIIIASSCL